MRSGGGDPDEVRYLNALCVRAYTHLRVEPPRQWAFGHFFMADFPATLAATAWLQVITAALLLAGILVGVTIVSQNPAALYACIPSHLDPPRPLRHVAHSPPHRA